MKTTFRLQAITSLFLVMTLTLSVASPALADSGYVEARDENIIADPATGALAFIGSQPGQAAESSFSNLSTGSPAANAVAFLSTYAGQMGLSDVSAELTLVKTTSGADGRSTLRYQQSYQGIAVFGGEVIVNLNAQGALLSLTAKTSPHLQMATDPTLTADDALTAAIQAVAKYNNLDAASLTAETPKLQIYDSRLLDADGLAPRLVWNTLVSSPANDINEVVLVDANNAAIALHYPSMFVAPNESAGAAPAEVSSETLGSPQISIYTLNNTSPPPGDPAWPGTYICDQSTCGSVVGNPDATNAYLNALDAYNFMQNQLGIDSIDNAGSNIDGTIHYNVNYKKVAWLTQIHVAAYGSGYTGADDMAGHAIGFGLLEHSGASGLFMTGQPGAIARSMNDMWGEFIDQTNGRGNDAITVKWVIGEDWPDGAQRNMQSPTLAPFNDPDSMTSANYYTGGDESIGVFKNAGVNNKAVYLMANGGTHNGKTVTALGITKVARIYYEVEKNLLASASTYFDLYYAVKQACYNLLGTAGITSLNCDQVRNALDAVQMNLTNSSAAVASYCPAGKSRGNPSTLFFDSLESGLGQWTFPSTPWTQVVNQATHGLYHLEGPEPASPGQTIAQMVNSVLIPSGYPVYLFFEHWFNFESDGSIYNDGGVLQYTTDNVLWINAGSLYASGKNYGGTLFTGLENPLGGQSAFVAGVSNYVSTSYNLTSLAGQQVKFRWVVATDNGNPNHPKPGDPGAGWYIDNIQIYRCVSVPGIPKPVSPALNALKTTYTPTLDWSTAVPDLDHYIVQVSTSSTFATIAYEATSIDSVHTLTTPLSANKKYYWRVRAYNYANDGSAWSTAYYFRTALAPPPLVKPIGTSTSTKPTFDWASVSGAKGYTIQVSKFANFSKPVINVTLLKPTSAYRATIALQRGKIHYWRVRTNGPNGPSAWSSSSFIIP